MMKEEIRLEDALGLPLDSFKNFLRAKEKWEIENKREFNPTWDTLEDLKIRK